MSLEISEIKHVAALSKLGLSEKELEHYGQQLSAVLSYIDQLSEVDTSEVEATNRLGENFNVWGADEAVVCDEEARRIALEQAAGIKNGQIKVPRVLE